MNNKSPAFQFYPSDWLSDINIKMMSLCQRGAYIGLLSIDWINDGIPSSAIADLSELKEAWNDNRNEVLRNCFIAHPLKPDYLTNPRLLKERQKQSEFSKERTESGKKGAAKRWKSKRKRRHSSAIKEPLAENASSSSSSSSSSEDKEKSKRKVFQKPSIKEIETYISDKKYNVDPEVFYNHYESNGWMVGKNKMKSWTATLGSWNAREKKRLNEKTRKNPQGITNTQDYSSAPNVMDA